MPVEILSLMFVFVKEALASEFKIKEPADQGAPEPQNTQPSQSAPLLIGAVCKQWREITLETPQLWTKITVDLRKSLDGQLDMVNNWAQRSSVRPLDITVLPAYEHRNYENTSLDEFEDLLRALRSLVVRWNDVALFVPEFICHALLNDLQEAPHIYSIFFPEGYDDLAPIRMKRPLRPRRFISKYIYGEIAFEWGRLVFLNIEHAYNDELLYIIRHGPNLRYCIAEGDNEESGQFTTPPNPIINCSLIHLQTSCDIFGHLTLPSLLHLDYDSIGDIDLNQRFESLVGFLDRSCAPLPNFTLRCYVFGRSLFPSFEGLTAITHLYLDADLFFEPPNPAKTDNFFYALIQSSPSTILPCVKILELDLDDLSTLSWSLFSQLFPKDAETNSADIEADSIAIKRPFLRVRVELSGSDEVTMSKDTFLRLLEVKKSGLDLSLDHHCKGDLFSHMAQVYDMEL